MQVSRMSLLLIALLGLVLVGSVGALAQTPNYTFEVARVSKAPTIDGVLNDATWIQAAQKGSKTVVDLNHTGNMMTNYPRVAYLAYDDSALYVAFVNYAPDTGKLVTTMPSASHNDEVEIFVQTARGGYYQVIVTAGGEVDAKGNGTLTGKTLEVRHAVSVSDIRWIVEVAIPFEALGTTPAAGDEWKLNLNGRQVGAGDTWLAWNPTYGGFHNEARFATIVFGE